MKVTEHYNKAKNPLLSFEIIPPKRGGSARQIFDLIEMLIPFNPPFIDVTSHTAESYIEELNDGTIKRYIRRKRPGTIGLSAAILNRFGIDPVPHILCNGFTKEETEDALIELNYLGIHNVLAIRGDEKNVKKADSLGRATNGHASDLIHQIEDMNKGSYLENIMDPVATDFCIGVAGYPEKHFEAPNLTKDIEKLKEKIEAGADYIVTQMFFNNAAYFDFVEKSRSAGINVPIIPGLKVFTSESHLINLPKYFHLEIPEELTQMVHDSPKHVRQIGIEWAAKQTAQLLEKGVPGVHFYIMANAAPTVEAIHLSKAVI